MMSSRILQVESLCIGTKTHDIVTDFSFHIDQGEILALTGKSGIGKTSVALSILNALPPGMYFKSGTIQFITPDGTLYLLPKERSSWQDHRGKNIGYIPQDVFGAFDPVIKMGKQMMMIVRERKQFNADQINRSLESALLELGISDAGRILNSFPHQLSGGQLQRCLLALTIVMKPSLIIADEPTSAVDKIHQPDLYNALKLIRDKYGIAILCITHDRSVVKHLANREIQMEPISIPTSLEFLLNEVTPPDTNSIIEVKEIAYSHTYGSIIKHKGAYIRDISFTLHKGECLGIIGESGSGKSTIAHLLVGLIPPDSGMVIINGRPIDFDERHDVEFIRSNVQLVMQDGRGSLHPNKSIAYLLKEAIPDDLLTGHEINSAVVNALAEVGLPVDILNRLSSHLSGGECFRVCIARSLLRGPQLLICDESTSALDNQTRDDILRLLDRLRKDRQLALILISHDEAVISSLADQIMVISEGEIVESGGSHQMIHNAIHPLTRRMLTRL